MSSSTPVLQIDIVSDVMCPWCVIGYKQLAQALHATGTAYEINWQPFELNPQMPAEGQNLREHIKEKYGSTDAESAENRARMTEIGNELGIDFRFSEDMRMHNTFNAHQLLHWAEQGGRKHDLKMALFTAHFTDRRNLSDINVLADIAAEIGLDRAQALAVLQDQRYADEVRENEQFWVQQQITGVPAVVFNRRHLVTGAQGVANYTSMLKQLSEMQD